MLDPNLIREQPDLVKAGVKSKGVNPDVVDKFLEVDKKRRMLVKEIDDLRHQRKEYSEQIGKKVAKGETVNETRALVRQIGEEIDKKKKSLMR